jgi:hypothetical protein
LLKQQQYSKMATSNALSTASILCSPKQVLFYTFPLYFLSWPVFFWQKIANFLMGFFSFVDGFILAWLCL